MTAAARRRPNPRPPRNRRCQSCQDPQKTCYLQAFDEGDAAERGGEVDVKFDAVGAIWVVPES
jgi:hypothetical protein